MNINIGDLFAKEQPSDSKTTTAYVSKLDCKRPDYTGYYLDFIFKDGTTEERYYNIIEIKGLLTLGWKHYPVRE